MNHSWHQLSIATPRSGRARTRSGLAICEPAISELRAHVLRSGLPPTSTAALSATGPWMTLRPVNNPAAGVAQQTRTGRHYSGMTRRDLAFVHLHRPIKAASIRAALERDPDKRIPVLFNIGHFPNLFSHRHQPGLSFKTGPPAAARTRLRSPSRQPR